MQTSRLTTSQLWKTKLKDFVTKNEQLCAQAHRRIPKN